MDAKNEDSEEESSSSMSYKPDKDDKLPSAEGKGSDTTITNDRSSTSDTVSETKAGTKRPASQPRTLPTGAAANPYQRNKKKPRRAGFREKFLQQLRVLVDRETQIESTIVHWSADGKSFLINDHAQFESDIIPTYFDNPTVFPSFLNKLSRWGFKRVTNKQTGAIEFCSPSFKRLNAISAPAAATDTSNSNDGEDDSSQRQQGHAMAQNNLPPLPNPQQSSQAMMDSISNIQRLSQQLSMSTQQSTLNQSTSQSGSDVASTILQSILGSGGSQQPFQSQHFQPNPIPSMSYNNFISGQLPSAPLQGYPQSNTANALSGLSGMLSQPSTTNPSTNSSPIPVNNNVVVQSLLTLLNRVCEDERQRRAQADAVQNAIIARVVQLIGFSNIMDETERQHQHGGIPLGTTVGVPHNISLHSQQVDRPPPAAVNPNVQGPGADSIAAILQAILNGNGGQLGVEVEYDREQSNGDGLDNSGSGDDEDDYNDSERGE